MGLVLKLNLQTTSIRLFRELWEYSTSVEYVEHFKSANNAAVDATLVI